MPALTFHEQQHLNRLLQQEGSIKYIFDDFVRNSGVHLSAWKDVKGGIWSGNETIRKKLQQEIDELQKKLTANIEQYTADAWNRSHIKTDDLINSYIKDMPLTKLVKDGMFARNAEALQTFLTRKVDGFTLSERVWNIVDGAKENVEYYLQSGLATGRRADLISQDIRQLLKEPDRRFHRIRNKDGKLVPSAPMKDYHPGQGVYRSSYKNAMRLAVTNTNSMYRQTDCERWSQLDFILGIDIKRSASTTYGNCDICDPLAGRYPKDYVFKGWHPWCICFATPVLMDEDAFMYALINDDFSGVDYITDIPSGSRDLFTSMLDKKKVSVDSYLFKDNKKFFDGSVKTTNIKSIIAKSIQEAEDIAKGLGVPLVDFSSMSIEHANVINRTLSMVPERAIPDYIGMSTQYYSIAGRKLPRKVKEFYGVSISHEGNYPMRIVSDEFIKQNKGLKTLGNTYRTFDNKDHVFMSSGYRNPAAITKKKTEFNTAWHKQVGEDYFFITDGELTFTHELGHVFDRRVGRGKGWKEISSKWFEETKIGHLKSESEAFADAFAEYFGNNSKRLPDYVKGYLDKLFNTAK